MKITQFEIIKNKTKDPSDPGFRLPGFQMRWLSKKVTENSPGRKWAPLKRADLPEKLREHIETYNPYLVQDGDTIRRGGGELVLAVAPMDIVEEMRADARERADDQMRLINAVPNGAKNMRVEASSERVTLGADNFKKQKL